MEHVEEMDDEYIREKAQSHAERCIYYPPGYWRKISGDDSYRFGQIYDDAYVEGAKNAYKPWSLQKGKDLLQASPDEHHVSQSLIESAAKFLGESRR